MRNNLLRRGALFMTSLLAVLTLAACSGPSPSTDAPSSSPVSDSSGTAGSKAESSAAPSEEAASDTEASRVDTAEPPAASESAAESSYAAQSSASVGKAEATTAGQTAATANKPSSGRTTEKTSSTSKRPSATQKPAPSATQKTTSTTRKPTPPTTASAPQNAADYAAEVLRLVNIERAKAGKSALKADANLAKAAQVRAAEIVFSFSHTRPDGRDPFTAMKEAGVSYRAAGENIAWGQRTPAQVMQSWMNSDGHRENILSDSFGRLGVGYVVQNGRAYWVQMFAD